MYFKLSACLSPIFRRLFLQKNETLYGLKYTQDCISSQSHLKPQRLSVPFCAEAQAQVCLAPAGSKEHSARIQPREGWAQTVLGRSRNALILIISALIRHTSEARSQVSDSGFPEAWERWGLGFGFGARAGLILIINNTGRDFTPAWTNPCRN